MAPKFEVISGGMDPKIQKSNLASTDSGSNAKVVPHGNPQKLLDAAKMHREHLQKLSSMSEEECARALAIAEEGEDESDRGRWVEFYRTKEGIRVIYKDSVHHNGKLVRDRLRELLVGNIKGLEDDARDIIENGYATP